MKALITILGAAASVAFFLSSCASVDDATVAQTTPPVASATSPAEDNDIPLVGVPWVLTYIDDAPVPAEVNSTLTLGSDGRVTGKGGCNSYFGTYALDDDDGLAVSAIGATKMACPQPQMAQEQQFLAALADATSWEFEGDDLIVYTNTDRTLGFARAPL